MTTYLLIAASLVFTSNAFSHGEDNLGPHGGYIKMPGGFHTEAISISKSKLKIYLLDINWKNPTIENSTVQANGVACQPENDVFVCNLGKKFDLKKKGSLKIEANRMGQKGNSVNYDLPMTLPKSNGDQSHH